jgi:hypothetical protein
MSPTVRLAPECYIAAMDAATCIFRYNAGRDPALLERMYDSVPKELQPVQDRFDLSSIRGEAALLAQAVGAADNLIAWPALRASGRPGAARVDELIVFAKSRERPRLLTEYFEDPAPPVIVDRHVFRAAWARKRDAAGMNANRRKK